MTEATTGTQVTNSRAPLGYIIGGLVLLGIGAAVFAGSFGSKQDYLTGETSSNGAGLFVGATLAAVGQVLALIGVIAQGVKIGNRASSSGISNPVGRPLRL